LPAGSERRAAVYDAVGDLAEPRHPGVHDLLGRLLVPVVDEDVPAHRVPPSDRPIPDDSATRLWVVVDALPGDLSTGVTDRFHARGSRTPAATRRACKSGPTSRTSATARRPR